MKIHEFQGKQLLREAGVAVPAGVVARTPDEAAAAFDQLGGKLAVVKAQIHAGGRGKGTIKTNPQQRGVQLVKSRDEAKHGRRRTCSARSWSRFRPAPRARRCSRCSSRRAATSPASCTWASSSTAPRGLPVLMVSSEGGVNIEKVAAKTPQLILKEHFHPDGGPAAVPGPQAVLPARHHGRRASRSAEKFMRGLCKLFVDLDCSLARDQPAGRHQAGRADRARRQDQLRRQRHVPPQGPRRAARPVRRRPGRSAGRQGGPELRASSTATSAAWSTAPGWR